MTGTHAAKFAENPLSESVEGYRGSVLDFSPRPEHTSGNVLMASTYRAVSLARVDERHLPLTSAGSLSSTLVDSDPKLWTPLVGEGGAFVSPPLGGERKQQPVQLTPYVPSMANWTGVIGRGGRRWKPSRIVAATLNAGVPVNERNAWLDEVSHALDVNESDDMLAYFVQQSVKIVNIEGQLEEAAVDHGNSPVAFDARVMTPARQLTQDLRHVFPLKLHLTRRQWSALIEGLVRLGVSMHYLWALRSSEIVWQWTQEALSGNERRDSSLAEELSMAPRKNYILLYGEPAMTALRRQLRQHGRARIGINLLLAQMKDAGFPVQGMGFGDSWLSEIEQALKSIREVRTIEFTQEVSKQFATVVEDNQQHINASAGTLRNSLFFLRYAMGQLNASDASERFQDASYCIAHHEGGRSSRVALGSATLLALVRGCCAAQTVPVTLDDFRDHIGRYGIMAASRTEHDPLAATLESLGLLIDSPDAAGGRVLMDPFEVAS